VSLSANGRRELVAEAARAPSAHNTQPARWRFLDGAPGGDRVVLFEDTRRRLRVGDPENRDGLLSLGAAFEGMHLALGRRGLALGPPHRPFAYDGSGSLQTAPEPHLEVVAEADVVPADGPDPLAAHVHRRHTWRGDFVASDRVGPGKAEALRRLLAADDVMAFEDPDDLAELARLHDDCTASFMALRAYRQELYDWLRMSPGHPGWNRDGLTAVCLALSGAERAAGRIVMRPAVYGALAALGLGRALASEASQVRSAAAVVVLHRPDGEDPFHAARRLYRLWLEIAAAGFHLCPMSATADSPAGVARLRERFGVPADRRVMKVLRVGVAPEGPAEEVTGISRRLPVDELLV
jgi:nitroreductase